MNAGNRTQVRMLRSDLDELCDYGYVEDWKEVGEDEDRPKWVIALPSGDEEGPWALISARLWVKGVKHGAGMKR